MEKIMKNILELKLAWGLFFAAEIIVYSIVILILGKDYIEITRVFQLAIIAFILVIVQGLLYTNNYFSNLNNKLKLFVNYLLLLFLGIVFELIFDWFTFRNMNEIFIIISWFTLLYIGCMTSIGIYNKLSGEKLNEKLKIYKKHKNVEE